MPIFESLVARTPKDPRVRLLLGRAYLCKAATTRRLFRCWKSNSPGDSDGSLHVQLARAYTALGRRDKAAPLLTKSQELQKADEERRAAMAKRKITAPE